MEEITIGKKALIDLLRVSNELNDRIESLELMSNKELMASLKKSNEQVKKRQFANWDAL